MRLITYDSSFLCGVILNDQPSNINFVTESQVLGFDLLAALDVPKI